MSTHRTSGILLHPTSLPGPYGIGELGPASRRFIDHLTAMGQGYWQVLPLGPTSYGDSPYQSPSTFAGNPLLISLDQLVADGLLAASRLRHFPAFDPEHIDYGAVIPARMDVLTTVGRTFSRRASKTRQAALARFCRAESFWLEDYALFAAIKQDQEGRSWVRWPEELAQRDPGALARARRRLAGSMQHIRIQQYLFHDQWRRLRRYAARRGVRLVGDLPIFVAHDSADVWANPDLFFLDGHGQPLVVAGVPPDYFSATGQLWGNPLYRWMVHEHHGFTWWRARLGKALDLVDRLRIDHFRGFAGYWEVPAHESTAVNGRWVEGPGQVLFTALREAFGDRLPIIAEDLGVITPDVEALRDDNGLPGMRVLQFGFGGDDPEDPFKPHTYPKNCVAYTGTHDNDTTVGWFHSQPGRDSTRSAADLAAERKRVLKYVGGDGSDIHWDFIRLGTESRAATLIVPAQDLLGLDSSARLNVPGRPSGNWQWRMTDKQLTPEIVQQMGDLTRAAGRTPFPAS